MTTPMGTCCGEWTGKKTHEFWNSNGKLACDCECHTTPPTANMFQYRADPNEKKLDFTERTDEQNKAILDHARPLIEENRRLLGLDTPNTGTEEPHIKRLRELCGVPLGANIEASMLMVVDEALATQKSQIIAEVEGMKKKPTEDQEDGLEYDEGFDEAIDAVITRLKGM